MSITVTPRQAKDLLAEVISVGLVSMMHGSPGVGKSAIVNDLAKEFSLKLIDYRLAQAEVTDLMGFPSINVETGRAGYAPMSTFPLEGDEIPEGYDGWLLFFDELTSADRSVQKGAYKILLDRMVGEHKLHENVVIVCAGNKDTDNAIVEEMGTALQSRLVHFEVEPDLESFLEYAMDKKFDHTITSFLQFKPDYLMKFDPNHSDRTFACPRTWEFANKMLKRVGLKSPNILTLLSGALSEGVAREYQVFTQLYGQIPAMNDIVSKPATTEVPYEPSVLYALTGSIAAHATPANLSALMTYVTRLPAEFQAVTLRQIVKKDRTAFNPKTCQPLLDWVKKHGAELF